MVTVCVSIMAKSICTVDEMMKMDASVMWSPMTLVSTCSNVLCRFIQGASQVGLTGMSGLSLVSLVVSL